MCRLDKTSQANRNAIEKHVDNIMNGGPNPAGITRICDARADIAGPKLSTGGIDAIIDDAPVAMKMVKEYNDQAKECKFKVVQFTNFEMGYPLPIGSKLRAPLSKSILHVNSRGIREELDPIFFGRSRYCSEEIDKNRLDVQHMWGLFAFFGVLLLVTCLLYLVQSMLCPGQIPDEVHPIEVDIFSTESLSRADSLRAPESPKMRSESKESALGNSRGDEHASAPKQASSVEAVAALAAGDDKSTAKHGPSVEPLAGSDSQERYGIHEGAGMSGPEPEVSGQPSLSGALLDLESLRPDGLQKVLSLMQSDTATSRDQPQLAVRVREAGLAAGGPFRRVVLRADPGEALSFVKVGQCIAGKFSGPGRDSQGVARRLVALVRLRDSLSLADDADIEELREGDELEATFVTESPLFPQSPNARQKPDAFRGPLKGV